MKLSRTTSINFGWLYLFPLLNVIFLLILFFLLSSNFVLQPGISVSVPFSGLPSHRNLTNKSSASLAVQVR